MPFYMRFGVFFDRSAFVRFDTRRSASAVTAGGRQAIRLRDFPVLLLRDAVRDGFLWDVLVPRAAFGVVFPSDDIESEGQTIRLRLDFLEGAFTDRGISEGAAETKVLASFVEGRDLLGREGRQRWIG